MTRAQFYREPYIQKLNKSICCIFRYVSSINLKFYNNLWIYNLFDDSPVCICVLFKN